MKKSSENAVKKIKLFNKTHCEGSYTKVLLKYKDDPKNELIDDFQCNHSTHESWDKDLFFTCAGMVKSEGGTAQIELLAQFLRAIGFQVEVQPIQLIFSEYYSCLAETSQLQFQAVKPGTVLRVQKLKDTLGFEFTAIDVTSADYQHNDPLMAELAGVPCSAEPTPELSVNKTEESAGQFFTLPDQVVASFPALLDTQSLASLSICSQYFNFWSQRELALRFYAFQLQRYVSDPHCYDPNTFPHKIPLTQILGPEAKNSKKIFNYFLNNHDVNSCNNPLNLTLLNMLLLSGMSRFATQLLQSGKFIHTNYQCFILRTGCVMRGNALDFALLLWPSLDLYLEYIDNEMIKLLLANGCSVPQANRPFVNMNALRSMRFVEQGIGLLLCDRSEADKLELMQLLYQYGLEIEPFCQGVLEVCDKISEEDFLKSDLPDLYQNRAAMKQCLVDLNTKIVAAVASIPRINRDDLQLSDEQIDEGIERLDHDYFDHLMENPCVIM